MSGAFFSGAVALSIAVDEFMNDCHVRGMPAGNIHRAYVAWHGKCMCRVDRVFPCMVYIDSNHRDSGHELPLVSRSLRHSKVLN